MFTDNKYNKIYNDFIQKRKARKNITTDFCEEHHIIPKSLGGTTEKTNLIKLTPREHFFAHLLLTKITKENYQIKMYQALKFMSDVGSSKKYINSRQYETAMSIRYRILQSFGKGYQDEKDLQNNLLTEYTDINKVFERGTCKTCGIRPRAVNYIKNKRTYYRKKCDTCIENKNQFKIPEWKIKGYSKEITCSCCNFNSKYSEQLTVIKDHALYKTVCLNCQVELLILQKKSVLKPKADF